MVKDPGIDPPPRQSGRAFPAGQAKTILATDLFHAHTVSCAACMCCSPSSTAPAACTWPESAPTPPERRWTQHAPNLLINPEDHAECLKLLIRDLIVGAGPGTLDPHHPAARAAESARVPSAGHPRASRRLTEDGIMCTKWMRTYRPKAAHTRHRYAQFEPLGHTLFVTLRHSGNGAKSDRAADGYSRQLVFDPRARPPARWPSGPAAGNTQATQVPTLAKINTPVTRTRRHSPAHDGTVVRIGV